MSGRNARLLAPALLVALVLPLAGCETTGDPLATAVASPGQYDLYDCPAIRVAAKQVVGRQDELRGLMARGAQGPAGSLVNATTYEPEYVMLRGRMNELRRAAATNHCNFDPATVPADEPRLPPPARKSAGQAKRR